MKRKPYLLQNPGSDPRKLFGSDGIFKSKPKILYWRLKSRKICFFSWYFVIFTLKSLQFLIIYCLSKVSVITGPKNCFMLAVFISMIRNYNGFKVTITKYQLKKHIGLLLNESRQYNILGFDLSMPSDPKSFGDFRSRVWQKIGFFLHDFDSS